MLSQLASSRRYNIKRYKKNTTHRKTERKDRNPSDGMGIKYTFPSWNIYIIYVFAVREHHIEMRSYDAPLRRESHKLCVLRAEARQRRRQRRDDNDDTKAKRRPNQPTRRC